MTYAEFVANLVKPPEDIELSLHAVDLWHAATGVSGESGELLDAVKKHAVYNRVLDFDNIIEELGDIEFYMEQMRQRLTKMIGYELTRDEVIARNRAKLEKRYGTGYSDEAAQARADKEEGQ